MTLKTHTDSTNTDSHPTLTVICTDTDTHTQIDPLTNTNNQSQWLINNATDTNTDTFTHVNTLILNHTLALSATFTLKITE